MVKVFSGDDTVIDIMDWKLETLFKQAMLCPVTMELTTPNSGELIYHNGKDFFVSTIGLKVLRDMFGETYINDKVIYTALEKNGKIERDMG